MPHPRSRLTNGRAQLATTSEPVCDRCALSVNRLPPIAGDPGHERQLGERALCHHPPLHHHRDAICEHGDILQMV